MKSLERSFALITIAGFLALCSVAWERVVERERGHGYTATERKAHSSLLPDGSAREVVLWKSRPDAVLVQRQAEVYAHLYGITEENTVGGLPEDDKEFNKLRGF